MTVKQYFIFWVVALTIVFAISYAITGFIITRAMADFKVEEPDYTKSTLEVKDLPYSANEPLQPAVNPMGL